ncbi:hypothetical protein JKP88DRAFT_352205 [Tribonema minus]|uniref:Uncharacterized protein n=1 Tax=Tribonema minus TaxID=303371 RepID=A0A836CNA5_9STRA|nr:hypothetical protein JKP88DRAFT_352205 [Tribonema minus]
MQRLAYLELQVNVVELVPLLPNLSRQLKRKVVGGALLLVRRVRKADSEAGCEVGALLVANLLLLLLLLLPAAAAATTVAGVRLGFAANEQACRDGACAVHSQEVTST